ncbi:hypothetical protein [Hydrogenophaga sp.]|uniref:hypothetical protein n=1 Tax=Hydrogenophaga sp. TaxID=1904254 RepID=UPI002AB98061|nr:hypothetical protein [Hydrogenophaga sp.]MDZ4397522.1 hypothetical protein [Hydrogenophaga sp.]
MGPRHGVSLSLVARNVNFVWSFCNELSGKLFWRERRFICNFELHKYLSGASKES